MLFDGWKDQASVRHLKQGIDCKDVFLLARRAQNCGQIMCQRWGGFICWYLKNLVFFKHHKKYISVVLRPYCTWFPSYFIFLEELQTYEYFNQHRINGKWMTDFYVLDTVFIAIHSREHAQHWAQVRESKAVADSFALNISHLKSTFLTDKPGKCHDTRKFDTTRYQRH